MQTFETHKDGMALAATGSGSGSTDPCGEHLSPPSAEGGQPLAVAQVLRLDAPFEDVREDQLCEHHHHAWVGPVPPQRLIRRMHVSSASQWLSGKRPITTLRSAPLRCTALDPTDLLKLYASLSISYQS